MARTRLIKPDFFIDPDVGDLSLSARYAFAGLWCQADKEGRLMYEPRKLKVVIFPYDDIKIEEIISELAKKPFIKIYEKNGVKYIQIINWVKHQHPHHTEKESIIPPDNGYLTVKESSTTVTVREEHIRYKGRYQGRYKQKNRELKKAMLLKQGQEIIKNVSR